MLNVYRKLNAQTNQRGIINAEIHDLHAVMKWSQKKTISNSYTMGCPPVRGDNPRALASGLSYVQVDKHGITILYQLHQCRPCTSHDIIC